MVVLELVRVAVFPLQTLLLLAVQAGRVLARQPEPLAVQAAHPALLALRALPLLQAGCLGEVEAVAVVVTLALAVQAAQEAVALAVVAVAQHAVHTQQALVA